MNQLRRDATDRREFLIKGVGLLGFPLIIQLAGCEDKSNIYDSNDEESDDEGFFITSSLNGGHTHTILISNDDVANSPSSSKTLTSSSDNFHTHQITLTQTDYQALKDGETVVKTSTTDSGHSHSFRIKKP